MTEGSINETNGTNDTNSTNGVTNGTNGTTNGHTNILRSPTNLTHLHAPSVQHPQFPHVKDADRTHSIPRWNWDTNLGQGEVKTRNVAGHAMIYALTDQAIFDGKCKRRADCMMMLRDDGSFCFPGGVVDPRKPYPIPDEPNLEFDSRKHYKANSDSTSQPILTGINLELEEEINLDKKYYVTEEDYVSTHILRGHKVLNELELHFYAKEVTTQEFKEIEKNALDAMEMGVEMNGVIRVPLHTRDGKGLPLFLANHFAGNARNQLLIGLMAKGIFTLEEVEQALDIAKEFKRKMGNKEMM